MALATKPDDNPSLESIWSEKSDSSKLSSDLLMYREDMHLNPQIKTQKLKVEAQYLMFSSPSQDDKCEFTNLAKPLRTHSHKLGMWHCG